MVVCKRIMSDGREESDSVVHPNSCAVSSDSAAVPKKKTARRLVDCRDHLHLYLCIVGVGKPLAIFDHDPEMSQMNQIHQSDLVSACALVTSLACCCPYTRPGQPGKSLCFQRHLQNILGTLRESGQDANLVLQQLLMRMQATGWRESSYHARSLPAATDTERPCHCPGCS